MKYLLAVALIITTALLFSGCTQQPVSPAPTGVQAVTTATVPMTATLSDSRPTASLALDKGVILVSFHSAGAEKMVFNFGDISGNYGAANELSTSGPFDGSLAYQVPQKGQYLLNISGTGHWNAGVTPLTPSAALKVPVNLSGSGTQVTPFFYLEKGQYFFQRNETGTASPHYYLMYANGTPLNDANNTFVQPAFGIDDPHPFCFIDIPASGTYFVSAFSKNNPGAWSASISPVPPLPPMGPGPLITQWTGTPSQ